MDGPLFNGAHRAVNKWSDEGGTLAPHITQPLVSGNTGDARFNGTSPGTHTSVNTYIVNTPLTRGGGTMAK